jgi:hypothetical protein
MKVDAMLAAAAQHSNRSDEFVKDDTTGEYVDEVLDWYEIFMNAFNEAYGEAAKKLGTPIQTDTLTPDEHGRILLTGLTKEPAQIRRVADADSDASVAFNFISQQEIEVFVIRPVKITYNYLPTRLALETDEPIFPEESVDPMLYVFLAAARVYQSERKFDAATVYLNQYYEKLGKVRHVGAAGSGRRVPRRRFR